MSAGGSDRYRGRVELRTGVQAAAAPARRSLPARRMCAPGRKPCVDAHDARADPRRRQLRPCPRPGRPRRHPAAVAPRSGCARPLPALNDDAWHGTCGDLADHAQSGRIATTARGRGDPLRRPRSRPSRCCPKAAASSATSCLPPARVPARRRARPSSGERKEAVEHLRPCVLDGQQRPRHLFHGGAHAVAQRGRAAPCQVPDDQPAERRKDAERQPRSAPRTAPDRAGSSCCRPGTPSCPRERRSRGRA